MRGYPISGNHQETATSSLGLGLQATLPMLGKFLGNLNRSKYRNRSVHYEKKIDVTKRTSSIKFNFILFERTSDVYVKTVNV